MRRELPPLFAVFDCEPEWHTPFSSNRYAILRRVSNSGEPLRTEPYEMPPTDPLTLVSAPTGVLPRQPSPVEIEGSNRETTWWYTGDQLYHKSPIPVLDFLRRDLLPFEFRYTATNDETSWCIVRQISQRSLRATYETRALETRVARLPPIPLGSTGGPPLFVFEALLRDAITQEQTCPITCALPKECGTVLVANCFHWFEKNALLTWLEGNTCCPVCKGHISYYKELKV